MKEFNLLVGGPVMQLPADLLTTKKAACWGGADRGALRLVKAGITPQLAIGDFDSSTAAERELIFKNSQRVETAKAEKDDTDTELAVRVILRDYQPDQLKIYGATGGRIDHLLANLFFILQPEFYPALDRITLIDRQNDISFFKPGTYLLQKQPDKKYLAFVPLTKVTQLVLYDEKYRLAGKDFSQPISLASNEFVGTTAKFSFTSGVVCVIQSSD
ncbi:MAG: thiamine diphosphokinase [Liquorilactobacillus ghanensis]|uniref:thiamine diphosphokinase n=1 Tax=Liquorilactobacillus ghanensis TaxID=399370 RepID=UPI0039ED5F82